MKSFLVTLLTWGVLFSGAYYITHQLYYPPGDWMGALIVSFLMALGIGALRKARIDRKDAAIVARPEGPPRDGERVAIAGTIEPIGEPLHAPFSGAECVGYDYTVKHTEQGQTRGGRSISVQDRLGIALAPCIIRSGVREIRLLAFPPLQNFPSTAVDNERAHAYLATAPADDQSLGRVFLSAGESARLFADGTGGVRRDWLVTTHRDLSDSAFSERIIPVGDQVCVIGSYSAEKNAIVANAAGGGVRMLRGTRADAREELRAARSEFIGAAFLIIVPALVAGGVLTYREHYFEAHGQPSVRSERREAFAAAAAAGDVDAIRNWLRTRAPQRR